jgi:hypothetical protein
VIEIAAIVGKQHSRRDGARNHQEYEAENQDTKSAPRLCFHDSSDWITQVETTAAW